MRPASKYRLGGMVCTSTPFIGIGHMHGQGWSEASAAGPGLMWYEAWFRYAWNPERDEKDEVIILGEQSQRHYSISPHAGRMLVEAMNSAGQIAPKILGRIGITEGNRQTFSLGMTLSQITNVNRYGPNRELWHSAAEPASSPMSMSAGNWQPSPMLARHHMI